MLLPKDEARLLRRNLQGSPLATLKEPQPSSQQQFSKVPQSVSAVSAAAQALLDRSGKGTAKLGQDQEPLSQRNGISQHSSASPSSDPGAVMHSGCVHQTAAPDGAQACAECSQSADCESQHGADQSRHEAAAMQDDPKGHVVVKLLTANKSKGVASACSRFHVDSLKTLQRRVVAKKRKQRSISAADTEGNDSAASSCEAATMTFIEPHSRQAAACIEDLHPAKMQCQ